jgi:hypothetical protein
MLRNQSIDDAKPWDIATLSSMMAHSGASQAGSDGGLAKKLHGCISYCRGWVLSRRSCFKITSSEQYAGI